MKTVLFISNVNKANEKDYVSKTDYSVSTLIDLPSKVADSNGFKCFVGINRFYASTFDSGCNIEYYNQLIFRNPFNYKEVKRGVKNVEDIIKNNSIDLIFCCTPLGGYAGRILGKKYKIPVVYQVHGFHFYKGAPLLNWLIYYPIEKRLSKYTDILITINEEDYNYAKKKFKKVHDLRYIPGIGVDRDNIATSRKNPQDLRNELGLSKDDYVIISVGYLNRNKNHKVVIDALSKINNPKIHYLIAGEGDEKEALLKQAKDNHLENNIHLLGYRKDVYDLISSSDLFVLPSFREGLPVSVMEAMCLKTMVIASSIRGVNELLDKNTLFNPKDANDVARAISYCMNNDVSTSVEANYKRIDKYERKNIIKDLTALFEQFK